MKRLALIAYMVLTAVFAFGQRPSSFEAKPRAVAMTQNTIHAPWTYGLKYWNQTSTNQVIPTSRPKATTGDPMITERPEGDLKMYSRSGFNYFTEDGVTQITDKQGGMISVVTAPDKKTVYIQELVSQTAGQYTWVKGELSNDGKTITVPLLQKAMWLPVDEEHLLIAMLNYNEKYGTFFWDKKTSHVTLTIEGDKIKLNDTNEHRILGLIYENDHAWCFWGDYASEYTLFKEQPVVAPDNMEIKSYILTASNDKNERVVEKVFIGEQGNDVYIKGLSVKSFPNAWIKGVKQNNVITFPQKQLIGILNNYYPMYFIAADVKDGFPVVADFKLTYDSTQDSYSTDQWYFEVVDTVNFGFNAYYYNVQITSAPDLNIDYNVIKEQPEGVKKTYKRNGTSYYNYVDGIRQKPQEGFTIDVVYAPDGQTVYIKDPVCMANYGSWVKGTLKDGKIVLPMFQCVDYNPETSKGHIIAQLSTTAGGIQTRTYNADINVTEMTYTIDANHETISLEGTNNAMTILGIVETYLYQWTGYGDYASKYQIFNEEITTIPQDVKTEDWVMIYNIEGNEKSKIVRVGINGNDIYIDNLPETTPEAAIKGRFEQGKAIFETAQYLGIMPKKQAPIYFAAGNYRIVKHEYPEMNWTWDQYEYDYASTLTFTYDETTRILQPADSTAFIISIGNPSESRQFALTACDPVFKTFKNEALKPAKPSIADFQDLTETDGYQYLSLNIPTTDDAGNYIFPGNMAYQIYIVKNGKITAYTFTTDKYTNLESNMSIIPYNYTDGRTIAAGGVGIFLREPGIENIGVESINYTGNAETRSERVWLNTTNIEGITQSQQPVSVEFYTLSGIKTTRPENGIYIKVEKFSNHTSRTSKIIFK